MLQFLLNKLASVLTKRGSVMVFGNPDKSITTAELRRYLIWNSPKRRIFINHYVGLEKGIPHDHPWDSKSLVLVGGFLESTYRYVDSQLHLNEVEYLAAGTWSKWRPATEIHNITLDEKYKDNVWTLFITKEKTNNFFILHRKWGSASWGERCK